MQLKILNYMTTLVPFHANHFCSLNTNGWKNLSITILRKKVLGVICWIRNLNEQTNKWMSTLCSPYPPLPTHHPLFLLVKEHVSIQNIQCQVSDNMFDIVKSLSFMWHNVCYLRSAELWPQMSTSVSFKKTCIRL